MVDEYVRCYGLLVDAAQKNGYDDHQVLDTSHSSYLKRGTKNGHEKPDDEDVLTAFMVP
jgi:hypothetical protein